MVEIFTQKGGISSLTGAAHPQPFTRGIVGQVPMMERTMKTETPAKEPLEVARGRRHAAVDFALALHRGKDKPASEIVAEAAVIEAYLRDGTAGKNTGETTD